ncbi:wings apart-like protein regulation of heterochromatin-domain-containing protein [Dendryphion nanum]|uniref:Wings apart-like protein regulation of heterochromatin-domain-containing protein n=1 Tax=Dendryphion nanum TaxID=256645 RepID=A0A9P9DNW8_9PLEO|nr:wings apart-like protein regulation of heterochromatin-domain-containing protein [Dendryphion nanum]
MATAMSPTFTATDRRKRMATYGKPARSPAPFAWGEDSPSPERPRKLPAAGPGAGTLKKPSGLLGKARSSQKIRGGLQKALPDGDVFDVPSDEEMDALPTPAPNKKIAAKQAPPLDDMFDVPISGDEANIPQRRRAKTPQLPRKVEKAPKSIATQNTVSKAKANPTVATLTHDPIVPPRRRAKTPQVIPPTTTETIERQAQSAKRPVAKPRAASRATTPAPPTTTTKEKVMKQSALPPKKATVKVTPDLGVFDVPFSDDELVEPSVGKPRPTPISHPKATKSIPPRSQEKVSSAQLESDHSDGSRKRKRRAASKPRTEPKEVDQNRKIVPAQLRTSKPQQKDSKSTIVSATTRTQKSILSSTEVILEPAINKPKRTRVRTGIPPRPQMAKGVSSPAKLHGMLAVRPMAKSLPVSKPPAHLVIEDDETMYDIPEVSTPLARPAKNTTSGSATPKAIHLFKESSDDWIETEPVTPGLPSIRRLQLTDRRPQSGPTGLVRSSSDIPLTAHSRKPRLIDTLRKAAPVSTDGEDEDEEEDSEESEDADEENVKNSLPPSFIKRLSYAAPAEKDPVYDNMEIDSQNQGNSQLSQSAVTSNANHKNTYAKQRSYRQEDSFEDSLLASMDFDILEKPGNTISEDEEDPASQVQGIHDLRRKGQNQKFLNDTQTAIDDIAGRTKLGNSVRRSAMMDLCTQMTDSSFLEQMFDSGLVHQFLESITSNGEMIFDFAATVAVAFVISNNLGHTVLDDIHRSGFMGTLSKFLTIDSDVSRIAKERKTNMSRVGREAVDSFRKLAQESSLWSSERPDKVSPQIVALRTLELLVVGLRKAGSTETLVDENAICKLLDIAASLGERVKSEKLTAQDSMCLNLAFSIMEGASMSKEKPATWSNKVVRRVVEILPIFFDASGTSPIKLAVRLCMNLSNNKPKACDLFAGPDFVQPLVGLICHNFSTLPNEMGEEERTEMIESLILSLGAMINLAEYSDQARASVVSDGNELVDALAKTFLEGSEKAAQADSMEASEASVTIGYLTVLLGNLCLNERVRYRVRSHLPGCRMDLLVDKIREFIRYNERVDSETSQFQGDEGRETWHNFTTRLQLVVERLQTAES